MDRALLPQPLVSARNHPGGTAEPVPPIYNLSIEPKEEKMRRYWLSILLTLVIGVCLSTDFSMAQSCCTANETILSADGVDLASTKQGTLNTLTCQVDEVVSLHVRTIYVTSPLGCPGGGLPCGTADAIVVEWQNWYPAIIDVQSSTSASTTATCISAGEASIGVRVEERHQACQQGICQEVSPGFPVVSAPVVVEN